MELTTTRSFAAAKNIGRIGLLTIAILSSGQVNAASACKGLDMKACDTNASCGWVQSYERKDGRTVNAFCRTKSKGAKTKLSQLKTKPVLKASS